MEALFTSDTPGILTFVSPIFRAFFPIIGSVLILVAGFLLGMWVQRHASTDGV